MPLSRGDYTGVEEGLIMTEGVISLDGPAALLICCCKFAKEAVDEDAPAPDWFDAIEDAGDPESLLLCVFSPFSWPVLPFPFLSEADEEEDAGVAWPAGAGELLDDSFFLDDVLEESLVRDNCVAAKQIAAKSC